MTAPGDLFQLELVKLLLQVAWADHRMVRTEAELIRDVARKLGLSGVGLAQVDVWLQRENPLPHADLTLLKQHKVAVLAAVRTLALADDSVAPEEAAMLNEIEAALGP